jgi:hypothetical protein
MGVTIVTVLLQLCRSGKRAGEACCARAPLCVTIKLAYLRVYIVGVTVGHA